MRMHRIFIAALTLAAVAPAANAQVYTLSARRGMLGIEHTGVASNARQRVVLGVVAGSAAEKAGLAKGDTILSINGLPASQQVMNAPLQPGDTVTLRVRRNGRERNVRIVATEPERGLFTYALPDTITNRISIMMGEMRAHLDSVPFRMRIERSGDSTVIYGIGGDSARVFRRMNLDSLRGRMFSRDSLFVFGPDIRIELDSVRARMFRFDDGRVSRITADSLRRFFGDSRMFSFSDSIGIWRPAEMISSGITIGLRAVAGAELSELNAGLAEYFGTAGGVLVLNAREGTPAARAGLRGGDVILQANGRAVTTIAELRRAIDDARRDGDIQLRVLRRGQNVDVRLGRE